MNKTSKIVEEVEIIKENGEQFEITKCYKVFENGERKLLSTIKSQVISEPIEPEPTEEEIYQAEMLLMQTEIIANQEAQDEVLAEILLNQMEV